MAKQRIKREKDFEAGTVTFTVMESGESLTVNVSDISGDLTNHLLVHAINAKVGDAAADPKVDAMEAMTNVVGQLKEGTWTAKSGGGAAKTTMIAEALVRVTGQALEDVNAKLETLSEDELKDLKKNGQVKSAMADITAERAKARAKAAAKSAGDDALDF